MDQHERDPHGPGGPLRLLCLPPAGGSALQLFRTWDRLLPEAVRVTALEPPGRGRRFGEPPLSSMDALASDLVAQLGPELDGPVALFGASMGALAAFELARVLRRRGREPLALLVAARDAPSAPRTAAPIHHLPDREFVEALRAYGGTPPVVLANDELMEVFLPVLRADFAAVDSYRYREEPPLACPLHVYAGAGDPLVSDQGLAAWKRETTGTATLDRLPGDHFFFQHRERELLALMGEHLLAATVRPRPRAGGV